MALKHKIATRIVIESNIEKVWQELMDFGSYNQWNPFMKSISGAPIESERLKIEVLPEGAKKSMVFTPIVQKVEKNKHFSWKGSLPIPGLFTGTHIFEIEENRNNVVFVHKEEFSGILIPFMKSMLKATEIGFEKMNKALKDRVEKLES